MRNPNVAESERKIDLDTARAQTAARRSLTFLQAQAAARAFDSVLVRSQWGDLEERSERAIQLCASACPSARVPSRLFLRPSFCQEPARSNISLLKPENFGAFISVVSFLRTIDSTVCTTLRIYRVCSRTV